MSRLRRLTITTVLLTVAVSAPAGQAVFLDFDSETAGGDWIYSGPERAAIHAALEMKFAPFGTTFSVTPPVGVDYSTIFFNGDGGPGTSTGVDWRNVAFIDDAYVNATDGLTVAGLTGPFAGDDVIKASINLAGHELLHLLGTRHHDAFGPVGAGVSVPGNATKFDPFYTGPASAGFTGLDLNSLTTVLGFSADKLLSTDSYIGQRSALKILFDVFGVRGGDGSPMIATPEPISMSMYPIPNTLPVPPEDPASLLVFDAIVGAMKGEIDAAGESDYYSFFGEAGQVWTIEVMSESLDHRLEEGDLTVALLDGGTLTPIPYYADTTFNEDGFEGPDPLLLDVVLPFSGEYIVEIFVDGASSPDLTPEFELLVYTIAATAIPVPAAVWMLAPACLVLAARGVRRRERRGVTPA